MKTRPLAIALTFVLGLSSLLACNAATNSDDNNKTTKAQISKKAGVTALDLKGFYEKVYDLSEEEGTFKGDKPVVVDFYATWCGPCKRMAPVLEELAEEFAGKVDIYKVDVDQQRKLAQQIGIQSMPTFLLIDKDGNPSFHVGMTSKEVFKSKMEALLK